MYELLNRRFDEVLQQAANVEATAHSEAGYYGGSQKHVDSSLLLTWTVNAENIIERACGSDSIHHKHFTKAMTLRTMQMNHSSFLERRAVLIAAKEDFEGGYLVSIHKLIEAKVFASELEQAGELLKKGYAAAAAVIAGVVLETCMLNLCLENHLPPGKLDKMNADLAKAGAYNSLMQKRITALAAIRNSAAHGKHDEFTVEDVKAMIQEVERFLARHVA